MVSRNDRKGKDPGVNQHGICQWCGKDFDGENIIEYFIKVGYTPEKALETAQQYASYDEYGEAAKWDLRIGIYDMNRDRIVAVKCPECNQETGIDND